MVVNVASFSVLDASLLLLLFVWRLLLLKVTNDDWLKWNDCDCFTVVVPEATKFIVSEDFTTDLKFDICGVDRGILNELSVDFRNLSSIFY